MKLKILFISLIILCVPIFAFAAVNYVSGNKLFELLKEIKNPNSTNYIGGGVAIGYLEGIVDSTNGILNTTSGAKFCVPNGVSANQLIDITYTYFEQNPQLRHFTADSLVAAALQKSFPCK